MDWNWFFSSVAQSVAALVGTLLAFVIAKLLNNQADFTRRQSEMNALVRNAERIRDAAGIRNFDWYNRKRLERVLDHIRYQKNRHLEDLTPEQVVEKYAFPEYVARSRAIEEVRNLYEEMERERRAEEAARAREQRERARNPMGSALYNPPNLNFPGMAEIQRQQSEENAERDKLRDEEEAIRRVRVEVLDSIRNASSLLSVAQSNPESSGLVTGVLLGAAILFAFGVIYPLSFLPLPTKWNQELSVSAFFDILFSVRGAILTLAVAAYTGIAVVLWRVNSGLKYGEEALQTLREWTSEGAYSEYFEVWKKNLEDEALVTQRQLSAGS